MLKGLFIIMLLLAIGNGISLLINHFIPGSVIGMILLFLALLVGVIKKDDVKSSADALTGNMSLFFIPAGVGLMEAFGLLKENLPAIAISAIVSTVLVVIVTGWLIQKMEKK
jgi:holin-like protein